MLDEIESQLRLCNDHLAQAWAAAKAAGKNRLADSISRTWRSTAAQIGGDWNQPPHEEQQQAA